VSTRVSQLLLKRRSARPDRQSDHDQGDRVFKKAGKYQVGAKLLQLGNHSVPGQSGRYGTMDRLQVPKVPGGFQRTQPANDSRSARESRCGRISLAMA
jgi:hypothetical protein